MPTPNKVLIAGATRGVGALVVRRLTQKGVARRVLVRDPARAKGLGDAEIVQGDALDAAACGRAAEGCDAVVCTLGDRRVPRDRPIVDGDGVINLADAAVAAGARRFDLPPLTGSKCLVRESGHWTCPQVCSRSYATLRAWLAWSAYCLGVKFPRLVWGRYSL